MTEQTVPVVAPTDADAVSVVTPPPTVLSDPPVVRHTDADLDPTAEDDMAKSKDPAPDSLAETRKQIEQTRGELAETVEALAAKADVKARASAKAGEVKAEVVANPTPLYAAAAGLVALVALVIARKRRKGKKK